VGRCLLKSRSATCLSAVPRLQTPCATTYFIGTTSPEAVPPAHSASEDLVDLSRWLNRTTDPGSVDFIPPFTDEEAERMSLRAQSSSEEEASHVFLAQARSLKQRNPARQDKQKRAMPGFCLSIGIRYWLGCNSMPREPFQKHPDYPCTTVLPSRHRHARLTGFGQPFDYRQWLTVF